jgi:hypothetical protein
MSVPQGGGGQEQGVDAVEDASVAWQHGAGILYAGAALDSRFDQIAGLGEDIEHHG